MDLSHAQVVDWATEKWEELHKEKLRDPDRAIRILFSKGQLKQIAKGIYQFDPDEVAKVVASDEEYFSEDLRRQIFQRDGHKCVICAMGVDDGYEIHADHIRPRSKGGKATLENGQTICSPHNMLKKNYGQTENGKRMFMRLYQAAIACKDEKHAAFIKDILMTYDEHGINGHIEWNPIEGEKSEN